MGKNRYENTITNFIGCIAFWIKKSIHCDKCREIFMKTTMNSSNNNEVRIRFQDYTHNDEYQLEVVWLTRPTDNFAHLIGTQLDGFDEVNDFFLINPS